MSSKLVGLQVVGVCSFWGQIGTRIFAVFRENARAVFSSDRPWDPPRWTTALLLLAGDVESNLGPRTCAVCNDNIKTRKQTSICCNHTELHWIHLSCADITINQYNRNYLCALHGTIRRTSTLPNSAHQKPKGTKPDKQNSHHSAIQQIKINTDCMSAI